MPDDDLVEVYLLEFFKAVDLEENSKEEYTAISLLNAVWTRMTSAQQEEVFQIIGSEPPWAHRKEIAPS